MHRKCEGNDIDVEKYREKIQQKVFDKDTMGMELICSENALVKQKMCNPNRFQCIRTLSLSNFI